jgi:hypothetical protein
MHRRLRRELTILPHRARARSGGSSERQPGRSSTASTGLSPDDGLQSSHTAQGLRSASGSADGTTSRWVMEKAGENARRAVLRGRRLDAGQDADRPDQRLLCLPTSWWGRGSLVTSRVRRTRQVLGNGAWVCWQAWMTLWDLGRVSPS